MAYEVPLQRFSLNAAADLTGSRYCAVVIDANGEVGLPAAGARIDAVLQNKPDVGQPAALELGRGGITFAKAGGAIAQGALVGVNASGEFIEPAGASGDAYVGKALEAASGAGSVIAVLILDGLGVA